MLRHANDESAHNVDHHDQQAGHGVAPNELAGTVHGAIKGRLLCHFSAALAGFVFADQAGIEVGVNRHLLAWHGVQGEARANFGDAARTLGDDHEIDHHQDDEDHDTDRKVATHQEMPKGLDHFPGRIGAGVTVHQHNPAGGHVERQAQQRGEQQNGGESGEVERLLGVHADQQHHDGQCNIEGEQQVEQQRRQRQHHHAEDQDNQHRAGQAPAFFAGHHHAGHAHGGREHAHAT